MLEKIVNISAGSDYKQSSKPGGHSKVSRYIGEYHAGGNDSISLSPATGYLSILGWKLKKISSNKESIQIEFSFDDMNFSVSINTGDIYQLKRFEYIIKYLLGNFGSSAEINVKISSFVDPEIPENSFVKVHLPEIKHFLDHLYSACGHKSSLSSDTFEVQKIFVETENRLAAEFNYINRSLINFLEKFLSTKINCKNGNSKNENKLELNMFQIRKI